MATGLRTDFNIVQAPQGTPEKVIGYIGTAPVLIGTFTGATGGADGAFGTVPKPLAGQQTLFLRGDGTWATAGSGTVTSVSVTTANGVSGSVANATTSPVTFPVTFPVKPPVAVAVPRAIVPPAKVRVFAE